MEQRQRRVKSEEEKEKAELVQHRDEPAESYQLYVDGLVKYLTQTFEQVRSLTAAKDLERGCDTLEGPLREGDYVLMRRPASAIAGRSWRCRR